MKTAILILLAGVYCSVNAQEYKVQKSSGRLEIKEVNHVVVEGTTGNEIIFSTHDADRDEDDRAKGLRAVSSSGLEDNTGLSISVIDKGDVVEVRQLKKMDGPELTIRVPRGVAVVFSHTSPYGDGFEVKNFDGELDVSTVHNEVSLVNVSGPVTVKTVHGDIEASLGGTLKSPLSLTSVHGDVDVALPVAIKADFRMGTTWGEIFVDPDFKLEINKDGNLTKYSNKLTGKTNGGGLDVEISSTHSNVYLRKKTADK